MERNQVRSFPSDVRRLDYEPGNMTRYELVAARLDPPDGIRWVVSCTNMGGCMEVREGQYLSEGYVAEKLRKRVGSWGESDLTALRDGISLLISDVTA